MTCFEMPNHRCNHHNLFSIPQYYCPVKRCQPVFTSPLLANQQKDQLESKVDLQLKELHTQASSSSSSDTDDNKEDMANEKQRCSESELVSRSINTEISCLRKPYTQPEARPAWRYWKRGSAEPHHMKPGNEQMITT